MCTNAPNIQTDRVVYMYMCILTCSKYRQTGWLTSICNNVSNIQTDRVVTDRLVNIYMYQRVQYTDRQGVYMYMYQCVQYTDRQGVYMYMYQCVQYTNRQGGLHVHVPMCPIYRQTLWFTCTNVSNIKTDRVVYMYMYQRDQYTNR